MYMASRNMRKNIFKRKSIMTQWIFFVGIIVVAMILFNFIYYKQVSSALAEEIYENSDAVFDLFENNINSEYENLSRLTEAVAFNSVTQSYLIQDDVEKQFEIQEDLLIFIESMKELRDDISDIILINNAGRVFGLNDDYEVDEDIVNDIPERSSPDFSYIVVEEDGQSYFYIGIRVYSIDSLVKTSQEIGTLLVKVDATSFLNLDRDEIKESGWNIFFLDYENNFVETSLSILDESKKEDFLNIFQSVKENDETVTDFVLGDNTYYVRIYEMEAINGNIISIIPEESLFENVKVLERRQYIIMLATVFLLCVPFLFIMRKFLKPIQDIVYMMESISAGNRKMLKQRLPQSGGSMEIEILAESFNNMMDEINALTGNLAKSYSSLYEMKLETKKSELAHLRSQINPHFLYNTLESIKGIAAEEDVPRITTIATALGNMFRYSIKGDDIVPLKDEIKIIESYIMIQKIRFEDRFEVEYQFDEEILSWRIPKMLIQPLVENAVYHGLEKMTSTGHLNIGGCVEKDLHMLLWVQDDGYGMSQKQLLKVRESLKDKSTELDLDEEERIRDSIGLDNVNHRVRLMYGDDYGVEIESSKENGTRVEIRIPKDVGGN